MIRVDGMGFILPDGSRFDMDEAWRKAPSDGLMAQTVTTADFVEELGARAANRWRNELRSGRFSPVHGAESRESGGSDDSDRVHRRGTFRPGGREAIEHDGKSPPKRGKAR
jgi:hypothetical protein